MPFACVFFSSRDNRPIYVSFVQACRKSDWSSLCWFFDVTCERTELESWPWRTLVKIVLTQWKLLVFSSSTPRPALLVALVNNSDYRLLDRCTRFNEPLRSISLEAQKKVTQTYKIIEKIIWMQLLCQIQIQSGRYYFSTYQGYS